MTEPDYRAELNQIKEDIAKALAELGEKIETIRDEILEAIDDNTKETATQIQQIAAFQKNILEPNQAKIWNEGIGAILTKLSELEQPTQESTPT